MGPFFLSHYSQITLDTYCTWWIICWKHSGFCYNLKSVNFVAVVADSYLVWNQTQSLLPPPPFPVVGCGSNLNPLALKLFGVCPWIHPWVRGQPDIWAISIQNLSNFSLSLSFWNFYPNFPAAIVTPNSVLWLFRAVKLAFFFQGFSSPAQHWWRPAFRLNSWAGNSPVIFLSSTCWLPSSICLLWSLSSALR